MSSLFERFEIDPKKADEGISITYPPNKDGSIPTFIVLHRGPGNQRYRAALEREQQQYRRLMDLNILDDATNLLIMQRVFCSTVLKGWSNVQNRDGTSISFSETNALALFKKLPDLYYDLAKESGELSAFLLGAQENDAKN